MASGITSHEVNAYIQTCVNQILTYTVVSMQFAPLSLRVQILYIFPHMYVYTHVCIFVTATLPSVTKT